MSLCSIFVVYAFLDSTPFKVDSNQSNNNMIKFFLCLFQFFFLALFQLPPTPLKDDFYPVFRNEAPFVERIKWFFLGACVKYSYGVFLFRCLIGVSNSSIFISILYLIFSKCLFKQWHNKFSLGSVQYTCILGRIWKVI